MRPQVVRLGLCFVFFIAAFIAVRSQVVPKGFGTEGFHRAQAPDLVASFPLVHAGHQACGDCHPDIVENTFHVKAGVACESCHGPAEKHVQDFESFKPPKPQGRDLCARCHGMVVGRRADFPQVDVKEHNPGEPCMSCHEIHPSGGE